MQFVACVITPYEERKCRLSTVPRIPYLVGGSAGDVMRAWVSHSLVIHWIYHFGALLLLCQLYICTG